ncbi:MAG TPA: SelB C-terminal domain-containing protein, partial [bacterium]
HRDHQLSLNAESEKLARRIEAELTAAGRAPLACDHMLSHFRINDVDLNRILGVMILQKRAIRTGDGAVWSVGAVREAWGRTKAELSRGESKSASQLREALGLPRRHAIVLLEYFDKIGRLQRLEDLRQPGPTFDEPF